MQRVSSRNLPAPAPRIAITSWLRISPTALGERTRLFSLDPAYADRILAAGGIPLILARGTDAAETLAGMDGLLVSGGGDVCPTSYRATDEGACEDVDREADEWELALIAEARERALPTLGICRGMQLLAVAHGGGLAQRVDDSELHPGMGVLPPEETLSRRHDVTLDERSEIAHVFGTLRLPVNTIHHQVVADPGTLNIVARGDDGAIEALESAEWPAIGVQWHPEKMEEPEQSRLFSFLVRKASEASS